LGYFQYYYNVQVFLVAFKHNYHPGVSKMFFLLYKTLFWTKIIPLSDSSFRIAKLLETALVAWWYLIAPTELYLLLLFFLCTVMLYIGISCCVMLILCRNNIGNCSFIFLLTIVLFHFLFLYVCHSDSPISFLGCLYTL